MAVRVWLPELGFGGASGGGRGGNDPARDVPHALDRGCPIGPGHRTLRLRAHRDSSARFRARRWPNAALLDPQAFGKRAATHPNRNDKKILIWEQVAKREPQIIWLYTKNNTLKKENFDMSDAYTCALGYLKSKNIW